MLADSVPLYCITRVAVLLQKRPPMVCAHGGDSNHAPPNTADSFRAAVAMGVDCVEVDAACSRVSFGGA